nr:histone deacetylase 4 isoform X1 [Bactrocera oleae]XP_036222138.1 histone deacetylase 4 isoform X1 [Bactrocera oleae]XP_036222139.1 histone deacetylase 4 isoform X1 [Bactrocera oleae]XP_036222140.1 histone deacetylase 4 isoform X1 [Bactrocera oleae]
MTSPENRLTNHDIAREAGNDEHLHITSGTISLEYKPMQPNATDLDQQILELKKKQELQKQMLLHTFHEQTKELELRHQMQLEQKYQYAVHSHGAFQELREQRLSAAAAEEQQQRERREREVIKRKENCSANASPEVKQILNNFLINRKQAASSNGITTTSPYRNSRGVVKSSSGESLPAGSLTSSHPYKIPQPPSSFLKYESDFPLRKTASEPNLLKLRLKQSVIERKQRISGPAVLRRHERILQRRQQKQNSALTNCSSTPDSGPNSPPSSTLSTSVVGSRGSPTSAPIQEENEESGPYQSGQRSSINDLSLFSSPSMPNIPLGGPHLASHAHAQANVSNYNMLAALRQHVPTLAAPTYYSPLAIPFARHQPHPPPQPPSHAASIAVAAAGVLPPTPSPVVRSASATSTSSSQASLASDVLPPIAHAASTLLPAGSAGAHNHNVLGSGTLHPVTPMVGVSPSMYGQPITDAQVAHAHLNKQGHRPLGRTQSAPLPLGHPMLTGTGQIGVGQTHYENSDAEQQAHMLVTQKIRQTLINRSSVNREPQLKEEEDAAEVIDLTDKKKPPKTVITSIVPTSSSQNLPETTNVPMGACMPNTPSKLRDQEYLQQQRELLYRQALQMDDSIARGLIRPLSRTLSSPLVHMGPNGISQLPDTGQYAPPIITSSSADHIPPVNLTVPHRRRVLEHSPTGMAASSAFSSLPAIQPAIAVAGATSGKLINEFPTHKTTTGLAYDNLMQKHACTCGDNSVHPEHSGRLQSIWARLIETDLAKRCDRLRSRKATLEELQTVHTEAHTMLFASSSCQLNRQKLDSPPALGFVRLSCGGYGVDLDTTWNKDHTAAAARMAAGCVIDLAFKTAKGDIKNGFAVVRPPGHHAEANLAMGFCFFNSVAIAAKLLRQRVPEMKRVLIVDWDVHHGNGTQQAFYDSPDVLYLSIHRHDDGNFFPGTGGSTECGIGAGAGFNVNISWSGSLDPPLGDAEYIAAFRTIVMPIAKCFNPDIILVSAGFDAAVGHPPPLGGYLVSPACFGFMTRELMQLADGKVVLALEGGYDLPAICDSAQECVRALLGDPLSAIAESELNRPPCQNAIDTLQKTIAIQSQHWPCVRRLAHTVGLSALEALKIEHDESETITAMAGLSMQSMNRTLSRDDSEEPMDQDEAK